MEPEIALGDNDASRRNTGIRYEKKGPNYGVLSQDIYSVQDLAQIIGVHNTTILEQIKTGSLRARNFGGPAGYRILKEDVITWIKGVRENEQ